MGNPTIYGPHEEPNSRSLDYKAEVVRINQIFWNFQKIFF